MKKSAVLVIALLISTTMLAGCGNNEATKEEHKLSNDTVNSQIISSIKDGEKDNSKQETADSSIKE